MNQKQYKAAFATNDGIKISKHFGRAEFFEVIEVSDGKIISRERRANTGAHHSHNHEHGQEGHHHEMNHEHQERHNKMSEIISDCDYVVSGGMGFPIFNTLTALGKQVIIASLNNIEEALKEIDAGTIINHTEKLH